MLRTFMIASISGIFSLFPLLFTPAGEASPSDKSFQTLISDAETLVKLVYSLLWIYMTFYSLSRRIYQ
jgi:alpha-1,3-glucosyltransferase